jgi:hypothetical protein
MNVDEVYRLVRYICRKTIQLGYLPSEEFQLNFNASQVEYLNFLLGDFQQFSPNHPQARVEIGSSGILRQRLMPLHKQITLAIASGVANYPNDYLQVDSMETTAFKPVKYVQQHYLAAHINSVIDPIADNPIYLMTATGFQFYPVSITSARFAYFSTPTDIFWNFTLDGNNRRIYNPTGSINPIWNDLDIMEIVARMLVKIGVSLQAQDIRNFGEALKQQGQ